ncbi:hypothetical protein BH23ACT11_BH23ACT11_24230 [soil metagenome]
MCVDFSDDLRTREIEPDAATICLAGQLQQCGTYPAALLQWWAARPSCG